MNVEHINPFIEASQTVLKQIGIDAKLGKIFIKILHMPVTIYL